MAKPASIAAATMKHPTPESPPATPLVQVIVHFAVEPQSLAASRALELLKEAMNLQYVIDLVASALERQPLIGGSAFDGTVDAMLAEEDFRLELRQFFPHEMLHQIFATLKRLLAENALENCFVRVVFACSNFRINLSSSN